MWLLLILALISTIKHNLVDSKPVDKNTCQNHRHFHGYSYEVTFTQQIKTNLTCHLDFRQWDSNYLPDNSWVVIYAKVIQVPMFVSTLCSSLSMTFLDTDEETVNYPCGTNIRKVVFNRSLTDILITYNNYYATLGQFDNSLIQFTMTASIMKETENCPVGYGILCRDEDFNLFCMDSNVACDGEYNCPNGIDEQRCWFKSIRIIAICILCSGFIVVFSIYYAFYKDVENPDVVYLE